MFCDNKRVLIFAGFTSLTYVLYKVYKSYLDSSDQSSIEDKLNPLEQVQQKDESYF